LSLAVAAVLLFGITAPRMRRATTAAGLACVLAYVAACGGGSSESIGGGGGGGGGGSGPATPTIILSTSNPKVAENQPFLITATVTSSKPLTGTVTFYNFGAAIESNIPLSNGQAQTGQGYLNNPGLYQITASYSGDANNLATTTPSPLAQVITGTMPAAIQANTGADVHSLQVTFGVQ